MGLYIQGLIIPSLILAIVYFFLVVYGLRCLSNLHSLTPDLNTKKLFVMNCLLAAILRFLSFASMTIFNMLNIEVTNISMGSSNIGSDDAVFNVDQFFQKASLVQFDLPDFCFVSAYVLLLVVWAEAILQSRRHWLSSYTFRRVWILGYMIFNILLYSVQVSLYSLLFVPAVDQKILGDLIYLTLTGISIGVPILWLCCYLYLSIVFSGFPYMSHEARRRLDYLGRLGSFWTATRLVWGLAAFTSVVKGWFVAAERSQEFYIVVLISVFLICEVIPIIAGLRNSALSTLVVGSTHESSSSSVDPQGLAATKDRKMNINRPASSSSMSQYSLGTGGSESDPLHTSLIDHYSQRHLVGEGRSPNTPSNKSHTKHHPRRSRKSYDAPIKTQSIKQTNASNRHENLQTKSNSKVQSSSLQYAGDNLRIEISKPPLLEINTGNRMEHKNKETKNGYDSEMSSEYEDDFDESAYQSPRVMKPEDVFERARTFSDGFYPPEILAPGAIVTGTADSRSRKGSRDSAMDFKSTRENQAHNTSST